MRIGDLAHETGVSRRLLRYYEEQGLLRPLRRSNGYREYSESDVAAVRHIRTLLAAGLPTAVIARLLQCVHDDEGGRMVPAACPGMISHLRRERGRIAETIERLQTSQRELDTMLATALDQRERDDAARRRRPRPAGLSGDGHVRA
ncbi:MerR family transcriptional regulator [Nonomuraea basaltis]|uniref:MerR family transcriptional regulator n=1 Tax=Nonomuraea basaltis TaxID=2495887 RepID=UPI00110C407F|nr:MerR family transcriptional regulator [Nonomuraea basaltis]TMR93218.1 MerR family transcriptional regulator [Nonomuraea basaltis]